MHNGPENGHQQHSNREKVDSHIARNSSNYIYLTPKKLDTRTIRKGASGTSTRSRSSAVAQGRSITTWLNSRDICSARMLSKGPRSLMEDSRIQLLTTKQTYCLQRLPLILQRSGRHFGTLQQGVEVEWLLPARSQKGQIRDPSS